MKPSSSPAPEVSQAPKMVPELVLVAEISRFSLRGHSCLGNLILPASSLWGASSLGNFSRTAARFDIALDAATHWHDCLLDRTLHAFTLVLSMQTNSRTCYHAVEELRKPHHIPGDHAGKKNARDKA